MFRRKPSHRNDLVAALDIGSTRVSCLIARVIDEGQFEVVGCGQHVTRGLRRGVIVDMDAVGEAIVNAVHSAERQAEETIRKIFVGVPATAIRSEMIQFETQLSTDPINNEDLSLMYQQLQETELQKGREVLHAIPLSFQLDDQKGIQDPKGMYGESLKVKLHLMTAPLNILRNFMACVSSCHLDVAGFVAAPHASALATLVEDEMELGTTLIDMGGGSTSMISYVNGYPSFLTSIPLGGSHITQDIARVFSTPLMHAERLKTLYGAAVSLTSDERETISIPQVGEDEMSEMLNISKAQLNQVVQPRLEEIFSYLKRRMSQGPEVVFTNRLVLTGGASELSGLREFVAEFMGKHVRMGHLNAASLQEILPGGGAALATSIGILRYATRELASTPSVGAQEKKGFFAHLKSIFR